MPCRKQLDDTDKRALEGLAVAKPVPHNQVEIDIPRNRLTAVREWKHQAIDEVSTDLCAQRAQWTPEENLTMQVRDDEFERTVEPGLALAEEIHGIDERSSQDATCRRLQSHIALLAGVQDAAIGWDVVG